MYEHYLDILKHPEIRNGVPQRGTALWEIGQLIEAGLDLFPEEEVEFIADLYYAEDAHFEQVWMAEYVLELLEYFDK